MQDIEWAFVQMWHFICKDRYRRHCSDSVLWTAIVMIRQFHMTCAKDK
jgi:hypothetical protein